MKLSTERSMELALAAQKRAVKAALSRHFVGGYRQVLPFDKERWRYCVFMSGNVCSNTAQARKYLRQLVKKGKLEELPVSRWNAVRTWRFPLEVCQEMSKEVIKDLLEDGYSFDPPDPVVEEARKWSRRREEFQKAMEARDSGWRKEFTTLAFHWEEGMGWYNIETEAAWQGWKAAKGYQ